jgi:hypothetical protein
MFSSITNFFHHFIRPRSQEDSTIKDRVVSIDELTIPDDFVTLISSSSDDELVTLASFLREDEESESLTLQSFEEKTAEPLKTYSSPSYFELYVVILYSCSHNFPFALNGQRQLTPEFHVYDHPLWSNWHALWNMKPFELDPMHLSIPSYETEFQGVLFRLFLNPSHQILGSPIFHQGATLVFKGYNDPHNRYVIEWCQQKDHRYAYLKVVGTSKHGNPLPYNDPLYPSFILVVPRNLSTVPRPPRLTKLLRSSSTPTKRIPRFFCHH